MLGGPIICPGKCAAVFQAESHAILACIYEIQMNNRQGKYISIYSDTRRFWELFRLPKQPPHWYSGAKRHWTTFSPTILWDCSGSSGILGYIEIKLLVGSQGREMCTSLFDWNLPWGSVDRLQEERYNTGFTGNIWQYGGLLPGFRDSLKNWSQTLAVLLRLCYCPLTEYSQGLLLASLLEVTPWEDVAT